MKRQCYFVRFGCCVGFAAGLGLLPAELGLLSAVEAHEVGAESGPREARCGGRSGYKIAARADSGMSSVAVSECGAVLVSKNGDEWSAVETGVRSFFRDVIFSGGQFVAVGGSYLFSSGAIVTSTNGEKWTIRRCGARAIYRGITFGGGTYVIVGDGGTILTSKDGANWKARWSGIDGTLADVAYGNGSFVAVGEDGKCVTSADGQSWTEEKTGVRCYLGSIRFGREFVAGGGGTILFSSNGVLWTDRSVDRMGVVTRDAGTVADVVQVAAGDAADGSIAGSRGDGD